MWFQAAKKSSWEPSVSHYSPQFLNQLRKRDLQSTGLGVLFILAHISFYNTFHFLSVLVINYHFLCLLKHPSISLPIHLAVHLTCIISAICLANFTRMLYCIFVSKTHGIGSILCNTIKTNGWSQIAFKMTSLIQAHFVLCGQVNILVL